MKKAAGICLGLCVALGVVVAIADASYRRSQDPAMETLGLTSMALAVLMLLAAIILFAVGLKRGANKSEAAAHPDRTVYRLAPGNRAFLKLAGVVTLPALGFGLFILMMAEKMRVIIGPDALTVVHRGTRTVAWSAITALEWQAARRSGAQRRPAFLTVRYRDPKGRDKHFVVVPSQWERQDALVKQIVDRSGHELALPGGESLVPAAAAA